MRELARQAGVSHATVSRALRNDPRISEAVTRRLQRLARKLGYRRDPKLAAFMTHLRNKPQQGFHGTLAWITDYNLTLPQEQEIHGFYWGHAERRAAELGYRLECFSGVRSADAPRLGRILRSRSIQGVALRNMDAVDYARWNWDWRRLACVHNGALQSVPLVDASDADDVANNLHLFEVLSKKQYRRIGVLTLRSIEAGIQFSLCGAQARFALVHPEHPCFPPCLLDDLGAAARRQAAAWLKRHDVECVVTQAPGMREFLEELGHPVPRRIGCAAQGVGQHSVYSGIYQRDDELARSMIESVVNSLALGRFGLPAIPRQILIPGTWHQGETTR